MALDFAYQENLPDKYILLRRGQRGTSGFLEISLVKGNNGRLI